MRRFTPVGICFLLVSFGLGTGAISQDLLAQQTKTIRELDRTQFGIGYVANAPDEMGGVGGYVVFDKWGGIGVYVDYKWDLSSPANEEGYEEGLTAEEVPFVVANANFLERKSSYKGFNVALVRPISSFLMVYGGGGMAKRTRYHSYEDVSTTLGRGGVFWVESIDETGDFFNAMAGLMMRVGSRITSHFGFETAPRGVTAGLSLRLPRW